MKTIWIINHYACKPDEGAGSRHYDIAQVLVEKGYNVRLFAASFNHFSKDERIQIPGQREWVESAKSNFCIVWLKTQFSYSGNGIKRLLNMFSFFFNVLRAARQYETPDVVIGSSVHLLAPLAGYFIAKRHRAGFVTEIRDIWPLTLVELGKASRIHPLVLFFSWIETFVYAKANVIIATMPGFGLYLKEKRVDKPFFWIPNGYAPPIDGGSISTEEIAFREIRESHETVCIYAGTHGLSNNLDVLVDAASRLKEHSELAFVFIGDGPEKGRVEERAEQEELSNIHFFRRVSKGVLGSILGQCDIGLAALPNSTLYRYGISLNKLNDYLYYRCPVVLSGDSPDNPVLLSGCGLCVPPDDSDAMAGAILTLAQLSREERERLGEMGKAFILKAHSIETLAVQYQEVVELVSGGVKDAILDGNNR